MSFQTEGRERQEKAVTVWKPLGSPVSSPNVVGHTRGTFSYAAEKEN